MPTDAEIIFWTVSAIIAIGFIIFCATRPTDRVDVDQKKIERWEKSIW